MCPNCGLPTASPCQLHAPTPRHPAVRADHGQGHSYTARMPATMGPTSRRNFSVALRPAMLRVQRPTRPGMLRRAQICNRVFDRVDVDKSGFVEGVELELAVLYVSRGGGRARGLLVKWSTDFGWRAQRRGRGGVGQGRKESWGFRGRGITEQQGAGHVSCIPPHTYTHRHRHHRQYHRDHHRHNCHGHTTTTTPPKPDKHHHPPRMHTNAAPPPPRTRRRCTTQ